MQLRRRRACSAEVKMASPRPTQQRSAEESQKQFDRRMRNMVSLLKSTPTDTLFFHKRMSKSMVTKVVQGPFAYALEFPIHFLRQPCKNFGFGLDATFVMKDIKRKWPIQITMRHHQEPTRVYAYGCGGWKAFVKDNHIKVGDYLFFNLIKCSHFQVVIHRAPVQVHSDNSDEDSDNSDEDNNEDIGAAPAEVHPDNDDGNNNSDDNNNEKIGGAPGEVHLDNNDDHSKDEEDMDIEDEDEDDDNSLSKFWFGNTSFPCRVGKQVPPYPRFIVTIRHRLILVIPEHFWRLHEPMLGFGDMQLRGPNKAMYLVKATRISELEFRVCLDFGWEYFFVSNELQIGDVLEFCLVGNSCFTVDLVERMKK